MPTIKNCNLTHFRTLQGLEINKGILYRQDINKDMEITLTSVKRESEMYQEVNENFKIYIIIKINKHGK